MKITFLNVLASSVEPVVAQVDYNKLVSKANDEDVPVERIAKVLVLISI